MRAIIYAAAIPFFILIWSAFTEEKAVTSPTISTADSTGWITGFKEFRDAVFHKNKAKVKTFFKFPLQSKGNEIWYVAYDNDEKKINALPARIKPFTEADFDKYYDRLFSKAFIAAVLKVKSDDLFTKTETETPALSLEKNTTFKMYVSVDKIFKTLSLNLAFNTVFKNENGEVEEGGEYNIIYDFKITGGTIVFKQILIAG